jgi:hypothetical protein
MVWVTHGVDEEFNDACVIPTFKQSSLCIMVWACIMKADKGPPVVLEDLGGRGGGMTADQYQVQVLEWVLFNNYWQKSEEKCQVIFSRMVPHHIALNPQLHGSTEITSKFFPRYGAVTTLVTNFNCFSHSLLTQE